MPRPETAPDTANINFSELPPGYQDMLVQTAPVGPASAVSFREQVTVAIAQKDANASALGPNASANEKSNTWLQTKSPNVVAYLLDINTTQTGQF